MQLRPKRSSHKPKQLMADGKLCRSMPQVCGEQSPRLGHRHDALSRRLLREERCKTGERVGDVQRSRRAVRKQSDAREKLARDRASALEPNLSKLAVVVSDANRADGMTITRDGTDVGAAQWSLELPIDPGEHRITASAKGRRAWSTKVTVAAAHTERVQIPALQIAPEDHPAPPSTGSGQRIVGLVVAGVGLAGLGVGAAFGVRAKQKADQAAPFCTGNSCEQAGLDDWSTAKSSGNIATGLLHRWRRAACDGRAALSDRAEQPARAVRARERRARRIHLLTSRRDQRQPTGCGDGSVSHWTMPLTSTHAILVDDPQYGFAVVPVGV